MWPLDLSKGLVSVKEYFDSDKKKCFNAAGYDSTANKFCCFHLYKLIENPTFGDQLMSILWNGVILYLEYPIKGKKVPISPKQNNNRFFPPISYANTAIFFEGFEPSLVNIVKH